MVPHQPTLPLTTQVIQAAWFLTAAVLRRLSTPQQSTLPLQRPREDESHQAPPQPTLGAKMESRSETDGRVESCRGIVDRLGGLFGSCSRGDDDGGVAAVSKYREYCATILD